MAVNFTLMGLGTSDVLHNDIDSFKRAYSLNTGNLLFNYAAKLLCRLTPEKLSWSSNPEIINKRHSGLLIPMANHLGDHVDLGISGPRLEGVEVPVVILGIGVQSKVGDVPSLPQGTKDWLLQVNQLRNSGGTNISTRGKSSTAAITSSCQDVFSIPLGCPSLLINKNPSLGAQIKQRIAGAGTQGLALAVSAGNPYKQEFNKVERLLIDLVDGGGGTYIIQHPKVMLELSMGYLPDENAAELVRKRFFPALGMSEMIRWLRLHSRVYINVSQWLSDMRRFDIHVGTRIHGSQAAIQAGVPSVCLYIDSRTKELCEAMHIPHLSAAEVSGDLSIDLLLKIASEWDWEEYDKMRVGTAIATHRFLSENGVAPSNHLTELLPK